MENIQPLYSQTESAFIATITHAEQGLAQSIRQSNGVDVTVAGHGSLVPVLQQGDRVLAVPTAEGPVIVDRLRAPSEPPFMANHQGRLILETSSFIGLKVKNSTLTLDAQGNISIEAENVRAAAEVLAEIQGELVKLN